MTYLAQSLSSANDPVLKIAIVVAVLGFALLVVIIGLYASHRSRKLKLLEEALKSGAIDDRTKQELVAAMMGTRKTPKLYALGWFGMFAATTMLFTRGPRYFENSFGLPWEGVAWFAFALSLGAVTLPFAVRELHARRTIQASGHRSD